MELNEGTIVQGDGSSFSSAANPPRQKLYVVHGGKLAEITNKTEFDKLGCSVDDVRVIPDAELQKLPVERVTGMTAGQEVPIDMDTFLGSGHYMYTHGVVRPTATGAHSDVTTRTLTVTWFGGYHGGVKLIYYDANDHACGGSALQRFGVDGTWVGCSDRTDYWTDELDQTKAALTVRVGVYHTPQPDTVEYVLSRGVTMAKSVSEIAADIASIGGVIWKLFNLKF